MHYHILLSNITAIYDAATQLIRVSNEPAVHVRTRAMKALSTIIAADPGILSRVCKEYRA